MVWDLNQDGCSVGECQFSSGSILFAKVISRKFAAIKERVKPYKPSVLFVRHKQTVQNQIRRRKMRRRIRFCNV